MDRQLNSLFGIIAIGNDGNIARLNLNFDNETSDYVLRASTIGKRKAAIGRALSALADPEIYLNEKNTDLGRIAAKLNESFQKKYIKKLDEGYYDEEARNLAWKETKPKQTELLDEHRRTYPTQIKGEDAMKVIAPKGKNPIF